MHDVILQIKRRRKELGITQKELAIRCGMKQSAIARIESETISPTLSTLQQIADAMTLTLTIKGHPNTNASVPDVFLLVNEVKRKQAQDVVEIARQNKDILSVIIFGSAVRADCTKNSDIDICLIVRESANKLAMHYTRAAMAKACNHSCDILDNRKIKQWFLNEIRSTGVTLYELS